MRSASVTGSAYIIGAKDGVKRPVLLLSRNGAYADVKLNGSVQTVRFDRLKFTIDSANIEF